VGGVSPASAEDVGLKGADRLNVNSIDKALREGVENVEGRATSVVSWTRARADIIKVIIL